MSKAKPPSRCTSLLLQTGGEARQKGRNFVGLPRPDHDLPSGQSILQLTSDPATFPGMTSVLVLTFCSMPDFLMKAAMLSPLNLPAAQPVSTPSPSVFFTHKNDGTLLPSTSEDTMK